jgi:hypothetical protein
MEKHNLGFKDRLVELQNKLKAPKNLYNSFGKYKYRNAEGILEAVKPLLFDYGMVLTVKDEVVAIGERYYIKATATLKDTKSEECEVGVAFARESKEKKGQDDSQITGTASSYARKYALNGLFLLDDTKDEDSEECAVERNARAEKANKELEWEELKNHLIPEVKVKALQSRCEKEGVSQNTILRLYKVKSFSELTEVKFANINEHWEEIKDFNK